MKRNPLSEDGREFLDPLMMPYDMLTDAWMNAWMQPLATWQRFVGGQWQQWLDAMAHLPSPWLPALAAGREGQPPAIDFFLPWLPVVADVVPAAVEPPVEAVEAAAPKEVQPAKTPASARAPRKPAALEKAETAPARKPAAAKKTEAAPTRKSAAAKKAETAPAGKPASAKRPAAANKASAAPAPKPAADDAPADKPAPARRRTAAGKTTAPAKPAPRAKKEV